MEESLQRSGGRPRTLTARRRPHRRVIHYWLKYKVRTEVDGSGLRPHPTSFACILSLGQTRGTPWTFWGAIHLKTTDMRRGARQAKGTYSPRRNASRPTRPGESTAGCPLPQDHPPRCRAGEGVAIARSGPADALHLMLHDDDVFYYRFFVAARCGRTCSAQGIFPRKSRRRRGNGRPVIPFSRPSEKTDRQS